MIERLRRDPRGDVQAVVRVDDARFDPVRLHLKGREGSFRPIAGKPGFTLRFDAEATPGPRGWQKLHLNNAVEDPSFLREWIGAEIFRAAGVPAPRVAHATVALNGRALGLYVLKEGFTEEFLSRHFGRTDGTIFDIEAGHDVDQPLAVRLGRTPAAGEAALRALTVAAVEPDLARRWRDLRQVLDVESFLRFMAVEVMIGHWDGYALGRNNFRIYHDPGLGRLIFLPTGMDQVLTNPRLAWKPRPSGLVARALFETPEGLAQYEEVFREIFSCAFEPAALARRVEAKASELGLALGWHTRKNLEREAKALSAEIAQRAQNLVAQLAAPGPLRIEPGPHGVPVIGWTPGDAPPQARLRVAESPDGRHALHLRADGASSASWRVVVRLPRGRYQLEGMARVNAVRPLPFGRHHGARLRVAGVESTRQGLLGTTGWERLCAGFTVEMAEAEVELVAELRASRGEAWFEQSSLRVVALEPGAEPGVSDAGANIAENPSTK